MPATPSVRIIKEFVYRGSTQRWSNRYHFNGGTPGAPAEWDTLFDLVVAAEKDAISDASTIVEAIGYEAGSTIAARSKVYSEPGTLSAGPGGQTPGDCAAITRYVTTARTSKGHPVYLFNYYHGMSMASGDPDALYNLHKDALEAYAIAWILGWNTGPDTFVRAGPNGATATEADCHPLLTHRDFPR